MPSPKKPETGTAGDTPVSREAATFPLEFLPETCLPHRQELERLNDVIHSDIKEEVLGRGIEVQNVHYVLLAHQQFVRSLFSLDATERLDGAYSHLLALILWNRLGSP